MAQVVEEVLEQFGLGGRMVDPIGDQVWRLNGGEAPLALRAVHGRSRKGEFVIAVLEHLLARECPGLPRFIRAKDGSLGVRRLHVTWLVSEWVPGHGALLGIEGDALAAAKTLAGFHRAAWGLQPPAEGGGRRDRYERILSRLQGRIKAMHTYQLVARNRLRPTAMDAAYLNAVGEVVGEMESLVQRLQDAGLIRLAAESRERGTVAYRAVGEGGIVVTGGPAAQAVLVDWSAARLECHLRDLVKLLVRIVRASGGNRDLAAGALAAYEELRPLSPEERASLPLLIAFPEPVYKVARRYYENQREWSELTAVRKLNRALAGQRRMAECAAALRN